MNLIDMVLTVRGLTGQEMIPGPLEGFPGTFFEEKGEKIG